MIRLINTFVLRVLLFILIPASIVVMMFFVLKYKEQKDLNTHKLADTKTTLFIGDSHVQQAMNDHLILNSLNLSQNSESYYFSYFKLKHILQANKNIKKIFLGYGYHSLSSYYEDFVYGKYAKDISVRYFFMLPDSEQTKFLKINFSIIPFYVKNIFKVSFQNLTLKNDSYKRFGWYDNVFNKSSATMNAMEYRLTFQYYRNNQLNRFSDFNLNYLKQISKLCESNGIELVLLNTPLHTFYKKRIPLEYLNKYDEVIKNNNYKVLDLSDLKLDDSCYVPDGDHLSVKGANQLANYFNKNCL